LAQINVGRKEAELGCGDEFERPATYEVRVKGVLDPVGAGYWFAGFELTPLPEGESLLTGWVADQLALHRLLTQIRDLGLPLLSITRIGRMEAPKEGPYRGKDDDPCGARP
jgi:hypothetical protein